MKQWFTDNQVAHLHFPQSIKLQSLCTCLCMHNNHSFQIYTPLVQVVYDGFMFPNSKLLAGNFLLVDHHVFFWASVINEGKMLFWLLTSALMTFRSWRLNFSSIEVQSPRSQQSQEPPQSCREIQSF
jgi:hypothetical protein